MLHDLPFLLQEELQLLCSTSPTPSSGSAPPGFPSTSCVYRLSKELVFTQPSFAVRELPLDQSRNLRDHPESKRTKSHKETSSKERGWLSVMCTSLDPTFPLLESTRKWLNAERPSQKQVHTPGVVYSDEKLETACTPTVGDRLGK